MSHQFQLAEPVVKALQSQLATQLPIAVTAINADVTDGYTIAAPRNVFDHMPLIATLSGGGFPAVAIQDGPINTEDDLVSSVTGVHHLTIVVFISNPDPEALAWQLRRYQSAVALALQADRSLGGVVWTTTIQGIEPGPFLLPAEKPNPQGQILSWFAVDLEMRREEV